MSLVNDLLIEAERRRAGAPRRPAPRLDDLVPNPSSRSSHGSWIGVSAALCALGTLAVMAATAQLGPMFGPARDSRTDGTPVTPPPVAARPAAPEPTGAPGHVPAATTARRPIRVESISVERTPTSTRLRIVTDGRTSHTVEHDVESARLNLVLTEASLVEPTHVLDLLDTPIRSLDLRIVEPDLHLSLELDRDIRSQTRWLEVQGGATLVLDLQAPAQDASPPAAFGPAPGDASMAEIAAAAATPEPAAGLLSEIDAAERALPPSEPADRVVTPNLGDPAELRIERSQRDREREDRAAARAAIAVALSAARRARAEGRLDEADARFAEVTLLAPDERAALIEWADLLVELERRDDAIALVESARTRAPRHAGLLITHARLLEAKGELQTAIELLDRGGLALTEAPDVYALAAAYHQRAGDHETAIERYEQILRRFPEESRGWMGLGISLEAVGRLTEARDVYRISLQVGELPNGTRRWVSTRLAALDEKD